jgi:hypothetical protein
MSQAQEVKQLREFAKTLDSRFKLPFGLTIGWDGILGFVPGIGELLTNACSLYIIFKAAMLGCPVSVILRMGLNVLIDNILDAIPVLGNFVDIFWKANLMNMALLENYLDHPKRTVRSSRWVVWTSLVALCLLVFGIFVLTVYVAVAVVGFIEGYISAYL